jgi:hypothetical protein
VLAPRFQPISQCVPDLMIQPIPGTIYSKRAAKLAEHGDLAAGDTNPLMVFSNRSWKKTWVDTPVNQYARGADRSEPARSRPPPR